MIDKRKRVGERLNAFCPACGKETPHAVVAASNGGGPAKVRCSACSKTYGYVPAPDEGTEAEGFDRLEEANAAEGGDDEGEQTEEAASAEDEEEGEASDLLVSAEKLSEDEEAAEGEAEEESDVPTVAPETLRRRMLEVEGAEEEESDEEDSDEDESDEDDESSAARTAGLSSFGRSSFEEEEAPAAEEEEEEGAGAAKKRKRKPAAKKTTAAKTTVHSRSWEEEMASVDERKARPYIFSDSYKTDEIIKHVKFGVGKVVEVVNPTKINVLFRDGRKMMLQGKQ